MQHLSLSVRTGEVTQALVVGTNTGLMVVMGDGDCAEPGAPVGAGQG